jgi:hypothetical protein
MTVVKTKEDLTVIDTFTSAKYKVSTDGFICNLEIKDRHCRELLDLNTKLSIHEIHDLSNVLNGFKKEREVWMNPSLFKKGDKVIEKGNILKIYTITTHFINEDGKNCHNLSYNGVFDGFNLESNLEIRLPMTINEILIYIQERASGIGQMKGYTSLNFLEEIELMQKVQTELNK